MKSFCSIVIGNFKFAYRNVNGILCNKFKYSIYYPKFNLFFCGISGSKTYITCSKNHEITWYDNTCSITMYFMLRYLELTVFLSEILLLTPGFLTLKNYKSVYLIGFYSSIMKPYSDATTDVIYYKALFTPGF